MKRFFGSWIGVWICLGVGAASAQGIPERVDRLVEPLISGHVLVGAVVGVLREDQRHVIGYGETAIGSGQKPDGRTLYEIGSITKTFTAALLADEILRGTMGLQDPVQKHVPASIHIPTFGAQIITLEHLATHTSGLPRMPDNFAPADPMNPYADYTLKQMGDFLTAHQLRRAPGTYEYSNLGMGLLGHVVSWNTKQSYEQLLKDRIAAPLKMKDTGIALDEAMQKRMAAPYARSLKPHALWDLNVLAGAGAIRSTVDDMLLYAAAQYAPDDTPCHRALRLTHAVRHRTDDGLGIGLAWIHARDGVTMLHNGQTGGYASFLAVIPKLRMAVVVLSNTSTEQVSVLGEKLIQAVVGQNPEPQVARQAVDVAPEILASYAGAYAIVPTFVLTVTHEGDALMVQATGQPKLRVFAESETKFFYREVNAQITFVRDDAGRVTQLILHQDGRDMPAKRTPK